jgi:hypothetical protein
MKAYTVLLGPDPSSLGSQVNGLIKRGGSPRVASPSQRFPSREKGSRPGRKPWSVRRPKTR